MTAYCLQHAAAVPYQLTIFEASQRLGGKILTPRFSQNPHYYEAGAAEFYDYSPVGDDPLKDLILDLGLSIRAMDGGALLRQGKLLGQLDAIEEELGPEFSNGWRAFDRLAKDLMSPQEFYQDDPRWLSGKAGAEGRFSAWLGQNSSPKVRSLIETLIHSDLATEPDKTGVAYGLQNYLMNDPAYMRLYSIEGGNEQLVNELAKRIEATICLGQKALRVELGTAGAIRVVSQSSRSIDFAGTERVDEFDYLVVALPSGALKAIQFEPYSLAGPLEAHHRRFHHPAHYLRITLLFSQVFWRDLLPDAFCMLDAFGGCCLYDETARDPSAECGILGWLLGGVNAAEHSQLTDETLIELALASLPENLAAARRYLLEGRVHRWVGEVSAWPGGVPPISLDARHQPAGPEHPNLLVVGDYLFDSTLNGVLDSAEYVAEWLSAELNAQPAEKASAVATH